MKIFLSTITLLIIGLCVTSLVESFDSLFTIPWWNHPWLLLIHHLFLALVFLALVIGWTAALGACGQSFSFAGAAYCWLVANAGKYVPGKILMFAGRLFLCSKIGVRQSICFWALASEHFFMLLATLPFLVLVFLQRYIIDGVFGYAFSFIALLAILLMVRPELFIALINNILKRIKREPLQAKPSPANMLLLLFVYFIAWTLYGVSGVILFNVVEIQTTISMVVIASVFVVSWMVGFFSMLTPGGIGVREAALVLLLQPDVPASQAIALAVLARITWTIVEIAGAGIGFWLGKGRIGNEQDAI